MIGSQRAGALPLLIVALFYLLLVQAQAETQKSKTHRAPTTEETCEEQLTSKPSGDARADINPVLHKMHALGFDPMFHPEIEEWIYRERGLATIDAPDALRRQLLPDGVQPIPMEAFRRFISGGGTPAERLLIRYRAQAWIQTVRDKKLRSLIRKLLVEKRSLDEVLLRAPWKTRFAESADPATDLENLLLNGLQSIFGTPPSPDFDLNRFLKSKEAKETYLHLLRAEGALQDRLELSFVSSELLAAQLNWTVDQVATVRRQRVHLLSSHQKLIQDSPVLRAIHFATESTLSKKSKKESPASTKKRPSKKRGAIATVTIQDSKDPLEHETEASLDQEIEKVDMAVQSAYAIWQKNQDRRITREDLDSIDSQMRSDPQESYLMRRLQGFEASMSLPTRKIYRAMILQGISRSETFHGLSKKSRPANIKTVGTRLNAVISFLMEERLGSKNFVLHRISRETPIRSVYYWFLNSERALREEFQDDGEFLYQLALRTNWSIGGIATLMKNRLKLKKKLLALSGVNRQVAFLYIDGFKLADINPLLDQRIGSSTYTRILKLIEKHSE